MFIRMGDENMLSVVREMISERSVDKYIIYEELYRCIGVSVESMRATLMKEGERIAVDDRTRADILQLLIDSAVSESASSSVGILDQVLCLTKDTWRNSAERESMLEKFLGKRIRSIDNPLNTTLYFDDQLKELQKNPATSRTHVTVQQLRDLKVSQSPADDVQTDTSED